LAGSQKSFYQINYQSPIYSTTPIGCDIGQFINKTQLWCKKFQIRIHKNVFLLSFLPRILFLLSTCHIR